MKKIMFLSIEIVLRMFGLTIGRLLRTARNRFFPNTDEYARLLRFFLWSHRFESFGTHCVVGERMRIRGPVRVHLGSRCGMFDDVIIMGVGVVKIGDGSTVGHHCILVSRERVEIGRNVMVSANCFITDVDHEFDLNGIPICKQGLRISPVIIGDDVWVGTHSIILRGVKIGAGAVIGAGSVVTRDVPSCAVVVGNPARVVKFRSVRSLSN